MPEEQQSRAETPSALRLLALGLLTLHICADQMIGLQSVYQSGSVATQKARDQDLVEVQSLVVVTSTLLPKDIESQ